MGSANDALSEDGVRVCVALGRNCKGLESNGQKFLLAVGLSIERSNSLTEVRDFNFFERKSNYLKKVLTSLRQDPISNPPPVTLANTSSTLNTHSQNFSNAFCVPDVTCFYNFGIKHQARAGSLLIGFLV